MEYEIRIRKNKQGEDRFAVSLPVWIKGERKTLTGGTHSSEAEAIRAGERLLMANETDAKKRQALAADIPFLEWSETWLKDLGVKESTRRCYQYRLDKYILPYLGNFALKDITRSVLADWLSTLPTKGVKKIAFPPVRISLNAAYRRGMLADNPTNGVAEEYIKGSKAIENEEKEAKQVKVWDYVEAKKLLDASVGHRAEALVVLGLYGGLRPGEVCALTWDCFDWLEGTVRISKTRSTFNGYQYEGSTKTGLSRTVKLPFDAIQRLLTMQDQRIAAPTERLYEVTHFQVVGQNMKAICKKAGVPYLKPHCLRHTCASMMLSRGVPVAAVSEILGHSNPHTTLTVYSHCLPTDVSNASGVLEMAMGTAPGPTPVGWVPVEAEVTDSEAPARQAELEKIISDTAVLAELEADLAAESDPLDSVG